MIFGSDLDVLELHERYFALCTAYLRGAVRLCDDLAHAVSVPTFANASVILWMARHATELFYKGCLVSATGSVPRPPAPMRGHNLTFLESQFRKHFPADRFAFSPPASEHLVGDRWSGKDIQDFLHFANSVHERFRYPTDSRGHAFRDAQGVDPASLLNHLIQAQIQMGRIIAKMTAARAETAGGAPGNASDDRHKSPS
jgi:hypothetical protein